jgi:hypothetical protein
MAAVTSTPCTVATWGARRRLTIPGPHAASNHRSEGYGLACSTIMFRISSALATALEVNDADCALKASSTIAESSTSSIDNNGTGPALSRSVQECWVHEQAGASTVGDGAAKTAALTKSSHGPGLAGRRNRGWLSPLANGNLAYVDPCSTELVDVGCTSDFRPV